MDNDMSGAYSMHRRDEKCIQNFCQKSEGKRPLRRPRCRWEDNIKIDLKEMGWEHVDWLHLAPDRDQWQALVNMVMNLGVL
jgi:hypothetical protein